MPSIGTDGGEIELDINALDNTTLWEATLLQAVVNQQLQALPRRGTCAAVDFLVGITRRASRSLRHRRWWMCGQVRDSGLSCCIEQKRRSKGIQRPKEAAEGNATAAAGPHARWRYDQRRDPYRTQVAVWRTGMAIAIGGGTCVHAALHRPAFRSRGVVSCRVDVCVGKRKRPPGYQRPKHPATILSISQARALQLAHATCVWRRPTPSHLLLSPILSSVYLTRRQSAPDPLLVRGPALLRPARTPVPPESRMMRSWSFLISFSRCSSFASVRPNRSSCLPISF